MEACSTGTLIFGDLDDPKNEVSKLAASGKVEVLHPEYEMKEKVCYIGLPKRFVAGSVVFGDKDECAENVNVTLIGDRERKTAKTDNYGDFEFEGLPVDKEYTVKVERPGYTPQEFHARTRVDIYLGDLILTR